MKRFPALLLLAFALLAAAVANAPARAQSNSEVALTDEAVAFVGVQVIPMTGDSAAGGERVLEDQTVVVRGGRIAELGPAGQLEVPEGALIVEGQQRYLIPGLAEMHGHIPSPEESLAYTDTVLFLYLANGVTTVRGMLGQAGQLALRERVNQGETLSPSLYLAGPPFTGGSVASPGAAREKVRQQHREGWNFLKVLGGMTHPEYDAMAQTAREVGIPFIGHVPESVGLMHALEEGQQTLDHLDGYIEHLSGDEGPVNEDSLAEAVRRTREAGTGVVPTMALWETLRGTADLDTLTGYPELKYMPPSVIEDWTRSYKERLQDPAFDEAAARQVIENRMRLLRALHEGGVQILFGTDAPQQFSVPGFSVHHEVERMADAGMSSYDILKTATQNVGTYFEDEDHFGVIEPGARADLVLLEANPLEDLRHLSEPAGVMVRGRWLPSEEIQERLREIAASYEEENDR